jgi:DNA-binding NtrC family response regulator
LEHNFPGNVRELVNLAETVVVLCEDEEVQLSSLPVELLLKKTAGSVAGVESLPMKRAVQEFERQLITRTLKAVNWNQSEASRQLGVHRNTLIFKMKEMDISKKK